MIRGARLRPAALLGLALLAALVTVGCWVLGLDLVHALSVGVAVSVLVGLVAGRRSAVSEPEAWPDAATPALDGTRTEVMVLSWGLRVRTGHDYERALVRMRAIARGELAERGLDWDDPADRASITRLLGTATVEVLSARPSPIRASRSIWGRLRNRNSVVRASAVGTALAALEALAATQPNAHHLPIARPTAEERP